MNKRVPIVLACLMLSFLVHALEKVALEDRVNFERMLAGNDIFFKKCADLELDPGNDLAYFLDKVYGKVFKVKLSTGKLVKTIGAKGQGPRELMRGVRLRVKNNKIFVLDEGFNGIKIFDLEGNFINEFKLKSALMGKRNFDVNEKDEIFLGKVDYQAQTMVSVFNVKGERLRSLIHFDGEDRNDDRLNVSRYYYLLKLDKKGNIYILYYMLRKLAKFDAKGKLLWETDIENEILDQFPADEFVQARGKTISKRWYIFNVETLENGSVIVGHAGGGSLFTGDGKLKKLLLVKREIDGKEYNVNLDSFRVAGNILMSVLVRSIFYYNLKEDMLK
jgi:hypothetical protein